MRFNIQYLIWALRYILWISIIFFWNFRNRHKYPFSGKFNLIWHKLEFLSKEKEYLFVCSTLDILYLPIQCFQKVVLSIFLFYETYVTRHVQCWIKFYLLEKYHIICWNVFSAFLIFNSTTMSTTFCGIEPRMQLKRFTFCNRKRNVQMKVNIYLFYNYLFYKVL